MRASQGLGEQGNVIIYFKATRDIFGINLGEQGIFLLLKGTLTELFKKQRNLFVGNKGERLKFSRDQGLTILKTLVFVTLIVQSLLSLR